MIRAFLWGMVFALALVLLVIATVAHAHEWLSRHPQGASCCNEHDCRPAKEGEVTNVHGQWYAAGRPVRRVYTNTSLDSVQGRQFWVCYPPKGAEPCLFVPGQF